MSPRWLFYPSPVSSALEVGTCTGWQQYNTTIKRTLGWSAGDFGDGTYQLDLRNDSYGAFLYFNTGTQRNDFLTSYAGYNMRVTDSNSNVYEFTGTMSAFAAIYIQFPLTDWSGSNPAISASNPSTIELYT
jgi:hypothetical protein